MGLSPAVEAAIARAVAAYLRDTPANEVPAKLRHLRSFRPQALGPHRKTLLSALEDEGLRDDILEWLKGSPHLKKDESKLLEIAATRANGWEASLAGEAKPRRTPARSEVERLREALAKERAKVTRAKEEARAGKESAREETRAAKLRATEALAEVKQLRGKARDAEVQIRSLQTELRNAQRAHEKETRSLHREAEKARALQRQATERLDASKREVAKLDRRIRQLESALVDEKARVESARRKPARPAGDRGPRRPLKAPKGLLDDAPATLIHWLGSDGIRLVVDGYNAGMAADGFPGVELEAMRHRLVDELAKLARRHSFEAIVVFDGKKVGPGIARPRRKEGVRIEYSAPDVIADDHIVELLQKLPPTPVIVATNDKELQGRVAALGATVATSDQLLAVLRGKLS